MRSPTPRFTTAPKRGLCLAALCAVLVLLAAGPALALLRIDFEPMYFRHPDRQVWDFSIIRSEQTYHIFYHTIHESTPHASFADTIWHATSEDLRHWEIAGPVLTAEPRSWKSGAVWAPEVVWDEASSRWFLAYTGCDLNMNQRSGLAFSYDLDTWTDAGYNPAIAPDPAQYIWDATGSWSDFRDPFVYGQHGDWHMLATAKKLVGTPTGVVYHATSTDLLEWTDAGPLFSHDGPDKWRVLESPQYQVIGETHHLLFGEYDTAGVTVLSAPSPDAWTMADRKTLDYGYAPEIDEFDPGIWMYARLAPYTMPNGTDLAYVVRVDTLLSDPDGSNLQVHQPHPLAADFPVRTGTSNLGNPVFGDNPVWRSEPSVGLVGNGYYGSAEYYQGPLSGRGAPGTMLGDAVTGTLESHPFTVTGNRMRLLVGGGDFPATCYVALVDTASGAVLASETGGGHTTMTERQWDLRPHAGRVCRIVIVDQESSLGGHINVDEIIEEMDLPAAVPTIPAAAAPRARAVPNPFNPATEIRFELDRPRDCRLDVYDLLGRRVWSSGPVAGQPGGNSIAWRGTGDDGRALPAGSYLYRLKAEGLPPATGKAVIVK